MAPPGDGTSPSARLELAARMRVRRPVGANCSSSMIGEVDTFEAYEELITEIVARADAMN
jgi:hypothetical protein